MTEIRISSRIRELRARYGFTQKDLAEMVGVRRETIGHIENSKFNPSIVLAYRISRALDSTVEEVFAFEEIEDSNP